jgi:hypothetical protein
MVGDLHGQLLHLLDLFLISTLPLAYRSVIDVVLTHQLNTLKRVDTLKRHSTLPATRWGHYGAETVTQLPALKAAYPDRSPLLRGKHKALPITELYGLYGRSSNPRLLDGSALRSREQREMGRVFFNANQTHYIVATKAYTSR